MQINLRKGLWRLWLFFSFVWVVCCAWQVYDARQKSKQAEVLLGYYAKSVNEAKSLELKAGGARIVTDHLTAQLEENTTILSTQKARETKFTRWAWFIPLVTLVFARGIPWVWEGFWYPVNRH